MGFETSYVLVVGGGSNVNDGVLALVHIDCERHLRTHLPGFLFLRSVKGQNMVILLERCDVELATEGLDHLVWWESEELTSRRLVKS